MSVNDTLAAFRIGFVNFFRPKNTEPLPWKERRPRSERRIRRDLIPADRIGSTRTKALESCT